MATRFYFKYRLSIVVVLVSLLAACGQEQRSTTTQQEVSTWLEQAFATDSFINACAETPGCSRINDAGDAAYEEIWRIRISRTGANKYAFESIDPVQVVAGNGVPIGAVLSDFALVGLDKDGNLIDGQPIRFPDRLRIKGESDVVFHDLSDRQVDTFGFLRRTSNIATIALQDRRGEIFARTTAPSIAANRSLSFPTLIGIGNAVAADRPFSNLPPYCSHVIVLRGEQDRHLASGIEFEDSVTLTTPGPFQLAAAEAALARMTPLLCQSVVRIAFGYVPEYDGLLGSVRSAGAGDMILINVSSTLSEDALEEMINRRLMLQGTIIHEAGHAAETLLTFESSSPGNYGGAWGFPARSLAAETVDKVRLEMGLRDEWRRLHDSFITQDWAKPYGSLGSDASPEAVVHAGFVSRGAAKNWAEDIASIIGHVYMSRTITNAYEEHGVSDSLREDLGCLVMRPFQRRSLPSRYAALFTKMSFLEDLGLLKREDVADCTGPGIGLHVDSPGFHVRVWEGTTRVRSYQNQLEARLGSLDGGTKVFEMSGTGSAGFDGKTYPARIELRLDLGRRFAEFDKVSWPRGVYKLGLTGNTNFRLRLDGASAGNFDAMDGYVLVAESSGDRITGSAVIQRVFRLHAPLPVPDRYDPPLVVRFMMQN